MNERVANGGEIPLWGCYYLFKKRGSVTNLDADYEIRLRMFVTGYLGLTGESYPPYRIEINHE